MPERLFFAAGLPVRRGEVALNTAGVRAPPLVQPNGENRYAGPWLLAEIELVDPTLEATPTERLTNAIDEEIGDVVLPEHVAGRRHDYFNLQRRRRAFTGGRGAPGKHETGEEQKGQEAHEDWDRGAGENVSPDPPTKGSADSKSPDGRCTVK